MIVGRKAPTPDPLLYSFKLVYTYAMKIFVICSKKFYDQIPPIEKKLKELGHTVLLPNCYDDPGTEDRYREQGKDEHSKWKKTMLEHSTDVIESVDAVLVLNFDKNGQPNYVGGATFLEMYDAFRLGKTIYMVNDVPSGILKDEIEGFEPIILSGNISLLAIS